MKKLNSSFARSLMSVCLSQCHQYAKKMANKNRKRYVPRIDSITTVNLVLAWIKFFRCWITAKMCKHRNFSAIVEPIKFISPVSPIHAPTTILIKKKHFICIKLPTDDLLQNPSSLQTILQIFFKLIQRKYSTEVNFRHVHFVFWTNKCDIMVNTMASQSVQVRLKYFRNIH